jgi:hypothetical protein
MKRALLLISFITATTLPTLRHEALAQQPIPLTGSAAKAGQPPAPAPSKSGKKASAKAAQPRVTSAPNPPPPPSPVPIVTPPPPVVEIMPIDLPPPAPNAPPAPASPGAGSVASGITPVRYAAPTPGLTRLTASVPVLPPKAAPSVELPVGAPAPPSASMTPATAPAMPRVTPYTPPIFWPPVPGRKPAQAKTPTVNAELANTPTAVNSGMPSTTAAKPGYTAPGYTAVVPITPFGAAPPPQPSTTPEPITFTVRLPTIVMWEPKP